MNRKNKNKMLPFSSAELENIAKEFGTPFFLYDERIINNNVRDLLNAFSWNEGFKEYFAIKATPNPYILKLLAKQNLGMDCSSYPELYLSVKSGVTGSDIMLTSNNAPLSEYRFAFENGAILNLDDPSHLDLILSSLGRPANICFRYNPGCLKQGNDIIGNPVDSKFGMTRKQIIESCRAARDKGIENIGIHTMVASNELDPGYFVETAEILFDLVLQIYKELNIKISFVNLGGGLGIPYHPEQKKLDVAKVGSGIKKVYNKMLVKNNLHPVELFMECGRFITGPGGYLVTRVRNLKETYKKYAGLDCSVSDLLRTAMYGAYHHVTVAGKENMPDNTQYDLTGSLCENNDKLAVDRFLPVLEVNDLIVIHDTGAHGHSMGYNYNGKLRSKELLLREDGSVIQIRREETINDLFATIDFDKLERF